MLSNGETVSVDHFCKGFQLAPLEADTGSQKLFPFSENGRTAYSHTL